MHVYIILCEDVNPTHRLPRRHPATLALCTAASGGFRHSFRVDPNRRTGMGNGWIPCRSADWISSLPLNTVRSIPPLAGKAATQAERPRRTRLLSLESAFKGGRSRFRRGTRAFADTRGSRKKVPARGADGTRMNEGSGGHESRWRGAMGGQAGTCAGRATTNGPPDAPTSRRVQRPTGRSASWQHPTSPALENTLTRIR